MTASPDPAATALLVVDLFCGLGGFSAAFRKRGHRVLGIDIVPPADVLADLSRGVPLRGEIDVLLASPPCTEFSRESMPWKKTGKTPDMTLVRAAFAAVEELRPYFWAIENVRGAVRWFPRAPTMRVGSRYLWTNIPLARIPDASAMGKERLGPSPDRHRLRSMIPPELSMALCLSCERSAA